MADLSGYFSSTGASPHDFAYDAIWEDLTYAARLPLNTTKGSSAIANGNVYKGGVYDYALSRQFGSPPQAARDFTPADTFDIAMICRDQNFLGSTFYLVIRVFNAAGDTVVGTLYSGVVNATPFAATFQNRHADGIAVQNNVSMPVNGHIVVEIGFYSADVNGFGCDMLIGEGSSTALPLNDTETNTDLYPWIAFTYGASGPSPIGPAGGIASGQAIGGVAMMRGTIQSEV